MCIDQKRRGVGNGHQRAIFEGGEKRIERMTDSIEAESHGDEVRIRELCDCFLYDIIIYDQQDREHISRISSLACKTDSGSLSSLFNRGYAVGNGDRGCFDVEAILQQEDQEQQEANCVFHHQSSVQDHKVGMKHQPEVSGSHLL